MSLRGLTWTLLTLLTISAATTAVAQEASPPVVEPSEAQVKLYTKAFEAFHKEDYPQAIELLRSAVALGKLNLLYLNLGRAYFRNGQCAEAEEAYDLAMTAPVVPDPPAEQIIAKIDTFRTDLNKGCPGTIKVECNPNMKIRVDDGPWQECADIEVPAGFHKVEGQIGTMIKQEVVKVPARGTTTALMAMNDDEMAEAMGETSPLPWITTGTGVAILGAAFVLDQVVLGATLDDFKEAAQQGSPNTEALKSDAENMRLIVLGTAVVGTIVTGAGLAWLLLGGESPQEAPQSSLGAWMTPEGAGVQWQGRW